MNGAGHCVEFSPRSGEKVMFVHVKDVRTYGMESGIYLSAIQSGDYVWVNGNWFDDVVCYLTQKCVDIEVSGTGTTTQISENSFMDLKVEVSAYSGFNAVNMNVTGEATSEFNSFNDMIAFDFPTDSVVMNLSSRTQKNQFSGFFCFAVCGNTTYVDKGMGNVIYDWWNRQEVNTEIRILKPDNTRQAVLLSGSTGAQLDLDAGTDFRIYSANGGLGILPGAGGDHNLYLSSLDATPQQIVFNAGISAPSAVLGGVQIGSSSTYFPIFNPSGVRQGYLIYGANGPEFDLAAQSDLRIWGGNGGLRVVPGRGTDHNLYMQNLDSSPAATVFNTPLAAAGGSANKVVCWKSDGVTLGHCTSQPDSSGGCSCK